MFNIHCVITDFLHWKWKDCILQKILCSSICTCHVAWSCLFTNFLRMNAFLQKALITKLSFHELTYAKNNIVQCNLFKLIFSRSYLFSKNHFHKVTFSQINISQNIAFAKQPMIYKFFTKKHFHKVTFLQSNFFVK